MKQHKLAKLGEKKREYGLNAKFFFRKRQLMQKRVALSDENSKNTSPNDSSAKPFWKNGGELIELPIK